MTLVALTALVAVGLFGLVVLVAYLRQDSPPVRSASHPGEFVLPDGRIIHQVWTRTRLVPIEAPGASMILGAHERWTIRAVVPDLPPATTHPDARVRLRIIDRTIFDAPASALLRVPFPITEGAGVVGAHDAISAVREGVPDSEEPPWRLILVIEEESPTP